jgi:thiol-disulfide isomerase/thioredoxin
VRLFAIALLLAGCGSPSHVELIAAPPAGDVAPLVQKELERAHKENKQLLVYVGATWCEPCRRFHEAAQAGKLNKDFPTLRLLEFDNDRDGARLIAAGYTSRLIPLFAAPNPDGRASGRTMEGSIKGDGAVGEIVPRLRALLQ